jgi:hypothetical protein
MPDSFDHLGGPAFYFYPPIAFWIDALLSVVTLNALPVSWRLSVSSMLLLWASGVAMHRWLETEAASSRAPLLGALAYMAAPYHLLDHYYRGAYAEFSAYVVLPVAVLSVRRLAEGHRRALAGLAVSYAALPMTNLPTSLLISVTALPLYVLYRGRRIGDLAATFRFLAKCAAGAVLGLCLAAIYLLPALTLQDWIAAESLWSKYYHPDRWLLLWPEHWPSGAVEMVWIITSIAGGYALTAAGVLAMVVSKKDARPFRSETAFWAALSVVCLLLIAGFLPWFWQLPFVAKVQFPWRLMIVVEFAGITALAWAPWPVRFRPARIAFVAALAALVPGLASMAAGIAARAQVALAGQGPTEDVKEFLPATYPQKADAELAELGLDPLRDVPTITCTPQPQLCRATPGPFGRLNVELDSDTPITVVVRRFAYPYWRLDPPLTISATEPLRLVSFDAPAGQHFYRLYTAAVPVEKFGGAVSGLALVLMLGWLARTRRG